MRPILLDTNAYVAFKKNHLEIVEILQYAEIIAISPIVIAELLSGFEGGTKLKQNKLELQEFLDSFRIKIFPITLDTSKFFSQIHHSLKCKGKPIPTNDMWIAAQGLEHGCIICTLDKHFQFIDGMISVSTKADIILN